VAAGPINHARKTTAVAPARDASEGRWLLKKRHEKSITWNFTHEDEANASSASPAWLRKAFAQAPVGIAITDADGKFLEANTVYCNITGRTEEELRLTDFISITHPDDRQRKIRIVKRLLNGEISEFSSLLLTLVKAAANPRTII
jgi:PAS domain-containing protein